MEGYMTISPVDTSDFFTIEFFVNSIILVGLLNCFKQNNVLLSDICIF